MNLNKTKTEGTCLFPELAAAEMHSMLISEFHLTIGSNVLSQLSIHNQGKKALLPYCKPQNPQLPPLSASAGPMVVLLIMPFPKYWAITENPSFEFLTCWKNRSWLLEFCSKLLFISRTDLYSGAHSGHSFSLSPRQRWWNECIHMKWTAGRSRVNVHAVHLLSWKILAFVRRSWISFLIAKVSSCKIRGKRKDSYNEIECPQCAPERESYFYC